MQKKKFATDVIWSVLALCLMNGVLQLVVYPLLNRYMGEDVFGNALYVLGILAVFAPTTGLAANNIRLVENRTLKAKNGDFLLALLPQVLVCALAFVRICNGFFSGTADYMMAVLLLVLTTLRYYGDVEYRMTLNYRGYLVYYGAISAGYVLGVVLYPFTGSWMLCFLLGELSAWMLLSVKGHIYWPLEKSENFKHVHGKIITLACSYLLYNAVLNLDRVLLQNLIDSSTVTIYYVASLLGKTTALLVGPLNGVIIGYLTQQGVKTISHKRYSAIAIGLLLVGGVLYAVICLVMPIFVRLLYPNIVEQVMEIAWLANLSQIICFSSSLLLTIMLTFASTRWQLVIQSIYAGVFLVLSFAITRIYGVQGFVLANLASNGLRLILTVSIGLFLLIHSKNQ